MNTTQQSHQKILGASYISEFFIEVKTLTEQYANYKNILIDIESKQKNEDSTIDPNQIENAKTTIINIRFVASKVYIHFMTLTEVLGLKEETSKPIIDIYNIIMDGKKEFPNSKDIETFVIKVNSLLVNEVLRDLLQTSQDILNSLYSK